MGKISDFDEKDHNFERRSKRNRRDRNSSKMNDRFSTSLNDDKIMGPDYSDNQIDDDYCWYLKNLINVDLLKTDAVEEGIREEEEGEGEEDPHFKMFMENLRTDGKSYVLKVCKSDGLVFLKYEDPYVSDYDCESDRGNRRKLKEGIRREKLERRKGLRSVERRDNVEDSTGLSGEEKRDLEVERSDDGVFNGSGRCDDKGDSEDGRKLRSDVRREKVGGRKGLGKEKRNLRVRRGGDAKNPKSLCVKEKRNLGVLRKDDEENMSVPGKDGMNSEVKRNLRPDDEHGCLQSCRNFRSFTDDEKIERMVRNAQSRDNVERIMLPKEKRSSGFQRRDDADTSTSFQQKEGENVIQSTASGENLKSVPGKDKRNSAVLENSRTTAESEKIEGRVRDVKSRDNVVKKNSFMDKDGENSAEIESLRSVHSSNITCKRKRCLSEKVSPLDNDICQPQRKCDKEYGNFDPCFKLFLNRCVTEGDSLVFVYNGKRLKYEEDDVESSSDSEIMVLDKAPDFMEWNYTPIVDSKVLNAPMKEDDLQCLGGRRKMENPKFRKEVTDILRRPYNKEEYKKLWQDVKSRKPTEGHLELRGGTKRFPKDTMGKSYLDHYLDLKTQLDAFKGDQPKRLNILRGFFYYLENMSNDGKFKPWLDESCLAIEPRCS